MSIKTLAIEFMLCYNEINLNKGKEITMKNIKQTTKLKLNALLTLLTSIILGSTEVGVIKLVCLLGWFVEFIIFIILFEKEF